MYPERYPATPFGRARRTGGRHGYVAYFPEPIPRSLELAPSTLRVLGDAEGALGQLAGAGRLLPNPDLLVRPYVLREAVASTRIEGTQATMSEVLETAAGGEEPNEDVEEVVSYLEAMEWGVGQLHSLPLSTRLMRGLHARLMANVRGRERTPGELRRTQNWIGPPGSTIETAGFVPPPPEELGPLLTDWERFANEESDLPLLVQDALLHSQFETIHPFLDGNGRLGRLLLVLFLIERERISAPLLYLSDYLERNRRRYYDALQAIQKEGDPTPWIDLFLTSVKTQAADAVLRAERILGLRERYREAVAAIGSANAFAFVDLVCENPVVTTRSVEAHLGVSRPTALRLLTRMEEQGILTEVEPGPRGQRRYVAEEMREAITGG